MVGQRTAAAQRAAVVAHGRGAGVRRTLDASAVRRRNRCTGPHLCARRPGHEERGRAVLGGRARAAEARRAAVKEDLAHCVCARWVVPLVKEA